MSKILVLSVSDNEEYILDKILTIMETGIEMKQCTLDSSKAVITFPGLEIRLKERAVYRNEQLTYLTHREFAILTYLAHHPGWVFSAGQIYEEVWGEDGENCGTAVASVIGQICRKLTPDMPKAGYIRTVLGSGYKFEVPQDIAE